jgi:molybdate transport system substrate-binding protein
MEHVFDGVAPDFALKSSTSRCLKANALRLCAALFLLVLSTFGNAPEAQSGKVLVFAAASLKTALDEINAQWQGRTGKRAVVSYAASSALAKQIEQGAPADIFISADLDWMEYLAERKLIRPETRSDLLSNRLVLIAPKGTNLQVEIKPGLPLASLLGQGHLALANTEVGILPDATHPRIIYPIALTNGSTSPDAGGFLDELKSPQARTIFEKQGFTMLN